MPIIKFNLFYSCEEDIPYIEKYGEDVMVTHVSKQNPMLGMY
jgi:hypothetical protein